jgi:hypothetical protein
MEAKNLLFTLKGVTETFPKSSELINEENKSYLCFQCHLLPESPKICNTCNIVYCWSCLKTVFQTGTHCLNCENNFDIKPLTEEFKDQFNNIVIKCPNYSEGCLKSAKYINFTKLLKHYQHCKLTKRLAVCNLCGQEVATTNELTEIESHVQICQEMPCACIYCDTILRRREIKKHEQICKTKLTQQSIRCPKFSQPLDIAIHNNTDVVDSNLQAEYDLLNNLKWDTEIFDLDVSKTNFNDAGVELISEALTFNITLLILNLSENMINDKGAMVLGAALLQNKTLQELYLSYNLIQRPGVLYLFECLEDNKSLQTFYIDNNFKGCGAQPNLFFKRKGRSFFARNNTMKMLNISNCDVGLYFIDMCDGLLENFSLKCLILSENMKNMIHDFTKLNEIRNNLEIIIIN